MRRLVVIINPQSNRGRTARLVDQLPSALRDVGDVDLKLTSRRGEAVALARNAALEGADAVIAVGGDGSVHETVNGLMQAPDERRPPLGVVPAGSGNDFAYTLGISPCMERVREVLRNNHTRNVDVGKIDSEAGDARFWVINVGTLLDGQVNLASQRIRWPRGSALYLRAALQSLCRKPPVAELTLEIDGVVSVERAVVFSMCNGPRSGGRFLLAPTAQIDDGLGDYLSVAPVSRLRLVWMLIRSTRGRHVGSACLRQGRFRTLSIRSSIPLAAHVDGEPWLRPEQGIRTCRVQILPAALRVLC